MPALQRGSAWAEERLLGALRQPVSQNGGVHLHVLDDLPGYRNLSSYTPTESPILGVSQISCLWRASLQGALQRWYCLWRWNGPLTQSNGVILATCKFWTDPCNNNFIEAVPISLSPCIPSWTQSLHNSLIECLLGSPCCQLYKVHCNVNVQSFRINRRRTQCLKRRVS